ncbi:MAG TPA: hypothetical protein VJY39_01235, partial [Acidisphaera sp.]|nr:hypothetical protein [Acidisphaera sp.]
AFADTGAEKNAALRELVGGAQRDIAGIGAAFDANCGYGHGPDLEALTKLLREIEHQLEKHAPASVPDAALPDAPAASAGSAAAGSAGAGAPVAVRHVAVTAAGLTSVDNRADALHLLDLVCRYYEQNEPSSPLPLMISRARKLADKHFLEILQDLAPDAVGQAQLVVQSREP